MSGSQKSSEDKRLAWCVDLEEEIIEPECQTICDISQVQTNNSGFRLLQYKWVMRLYITPVALNHFNGNIPDVCFKCDTHKGKLFHCLRSCIKLQEFWRVVIFILSTLTEVNLPLCPKMCVLGKVGLRTLFKL